MCIRVTRKKKQKYFFLVTLALHWRSQDALYDHRLSDSVLQKHESSSKRYIAQDESKNCAGCSESFWRKELNNLLIRWHKIYSSSCERQCKANVTRKNIFAFFTCDSDTHATWKMPYNSWVKLLFFTYIFAVLLLVNYSENRLNGSILKAVRLRRHLWFLHNVPLDTFVE